MGTDTEIFGHLPSGEPVQRVTLKGGGLTASVITWGSVIQDLRLEGHAAPLVLGFENFESYPAHSSYFGATPAATPTASAPAASRSKARPISSSSTRAAPRISTAAATISPSATGRSAGGLKTA